MSKLRLKWIKMRPATIDRVLATNGAHRLPDCYELRAIEGTRESILATIRRVPDGWRYWAIPKNAPSVIFADLAMAKAAARRAVDPYLMA